LTGDLCNSNEARRRGSDGRVVAAVNVKRDQSAGLHEDATGTLKRLAGIDTVKRNGVRLKLIFGFHLPFLVTVEEVKLSVNENGLSSAANYASVIDETRLNVTAKVFRRLLEQPFKKRVHAKRVRKSFTFHDADYMRAHFDAASRDGDVILRHGFRFFFDFIDAKFHTVLAMNFKHSSQ
jgi:hypothetical protein